MGTIGAFEIYMVAQADNIIEFLKDTAGGCFFFGGLVLFALVAMDEAAMGEYLLEKGRRLVRLLIVIGLASWILTVFMPSTKTLCMMYAIPEVVNNENVKALPDEVLSVIREKVKDWKDDKGDIKN